MSVKEQIKQFSEKSPCMCFNLRKAARAITQIYDNMFRATGLTASQATILNTVRMLGTLTVTELSEAIATDRTTITRNLKPLERDGLIKMCCGQDRRERCIAITPKGKAASLEAFGIWQKFQQRVTKSVGEKRLDKLCKDISATVREIQRA